MEDSSHLEEELFQAALERPAGEREEFLETACAGDFELRDRVLELLAAHDRAEGFMELANADLAGPGSLGSHLQPPDSVGPYKLLEKIGEGGCGVVYRAEQQHPIRRVVAVKIIKLGMDTRSVIARFQAERQALAMMDHPNIAKVLDAGTTESGRPYFVMELVTGTRITHYCDENQLPTTQRLNLFIQICNAVQHAHQKGIIHRDIKPSNILVTQHDGVAVPKIIDFGIAKATQGRLADHTDFTAVQQFIGTPAYMSPEQAEMSGIDIDTRSDIYSLGVLLYELLTGRTPFETGDVIKTGLDEMRRRIREDEPMAPSTKLSSLENDSATTIANFRRTDPPRLVRSVRGDLDWIVMKCLEKDRTRRYETANGLAAEVRRHLNNEPVLARAPRAMYRLGKMIRRNKIASISIALVALIMTIATLTMTWQAIQIDRAEHREAQARKIAEQTSDELRRNYYASQMNLASAVLDASGSFGPLNDFLVQWRMGTDLRGWEWYYLTALTHADLMTLPYHSQPVQVVAWSPNGRMIASAGRNSFIRICDANSGMLIKTLRPVAGTITALIWMADSQHLIAGCGDGQIIIWDLDPGTQRVFSTGHAAEINSISLNPPQTRMVSSSLDETIRIWDLASGEQLHQIQVNQFAFGATWSPDGRHIAYGSRNGEVAVVDAESYGLWCKAPPILNNSRGVAWSPDGRRLAWNGSEAYSFVIWDVGQDTTPKGYKGHRAPMKQIQWSPDGTMIATVSLIDFSVGLFDAASGAQIGTLAGHSEPVQSVSWAPDSRRIASGGFDQTVKIWDVTHAGALRILSSHSGTVHKLSWSPDGGELASVGDDQIGRIWSMNEVQPAMLLQGHHAPIEAVAWNPLGDLIATGGSESRVFLWDARTADRLGSLPTDSGRVLGLAWNPGGTRLAVSEESARVSMFQVRPFKFLFAFDSQCGAVWKSAWSPDGKAVAGTGGSGAIKIWNASDGKEINSIPAHSTRSDCLAWSPDGNRIVVGSEDGTADVWDVQSRARLLLLSGHSSAVRDVAWSSDGSRIASGSMDHTVRIWDAISGKQLLVIPSPLPHVLALDWSRDGMKIASSGDRTVRMYNATMGYAFERNPQILPELDRMLALAPDDAEYSQLRLEAYANKGSWELATQEAKRFLALKENIEARWYQTGWWLAGAYSPDINAPFSPGRSIDPSQSTAGPDGLPFKWQSLPLGPAGYFDLSVLHPNLANASVFAVSRIFAPRPIQVSLKIRGEAPRRAWLNGAPLSIPRAADAIHTRVIFSDDENAAVDTHLAEGWNTLLVQVVAGVHIPATNPANPPLAMRQPVSVGIYSRP